MHSCEHCHREGGGHKGCDMDLLGPSRKQATSVLEQCSTKEGESTVRKPAE